MKKIIYFTFLLGGLLFSYAQKATFSDADKKYEDYEYINAIKDYEKLAKKGRNVAEISKKIGDSYYYNARYVDAAKWYKIYLEKESSFYIDPKHYFRYSLCLKALEDYEQANEYLIKYYEAIDEPTDQIATYLDEIEANSDRYEVENAGAINSKYSDYGTTVYKGDIVFASSRKHKKNGKVIMGWNNQPFSSIYSSTENKNKLGNAIPLLKKINTTVNESTLVFTKDGKKVYFTRNNFLKKRGFSKDNSTLLKIYEAELDNGKWENVKELPFCSDEYNVAHPTLSIDEKTLYFVSDMPGTIGESDIWKVEIQGNGNFGSPVNLGPTVNTPERESFPFISSDNKLYYASNGKLGLGGLDIFVSVINEDGEYEEAVNLGKPVNSPMDDFGFFIDPEKGTGFFTSNRPGGKGDDDIYSFKELEVEAPFLVEGTITDADSEKTLTGVTVNLFDRKGNLLATHITDEQGNYNFDKNLVPLNTRYKITVEKADYQTAEKTLQSPAKRSSEVPKADISMRLEMAENITVGADMAKFLNVIIYFDLNKWNIREDATIELNKILKVMQDFPKIKVDIRSHTDSRGSYRSNEILSEKRAQSTRDWLILKGISADRLTAKGYGESQLLNHCKDGVRCSKEEHAINRRSEFIITSVE